MDEDEDQDKLEFADLYGDHIGFSILTKPLWSTFFGPQYEGGAIFKRGMYGKNGKLERMGALIVHGYSIRAVAKEVKVSVNTVIKLRKVLEKVLNKEFMCPCGKPVRHQGWCKHRYANSAARQAFIETWNKQVGNVSVRATPEREKASLTESHA